jgi:hypothetical protein
MTFVEKHKLRSSSICRFLQSSVTYAAIPNSRIS